MCGRPGRAARCSRADEIVIVATPDLASLRNAKNLIDSSSASRQNDAPPRLVLNMVGVPKRPEIKAADFAKALETELARGRSRSSRAIFGTAANNGQMIAETNADVKPAEMFLALAPARHRPRRSRSGQAGTC